MTRAMAIEWAERIRALIDTAPFEVAATPIHVTASVGVASTDDVSDPAQLRAAANSAMHHSKTEGGRNRVSYTDGVRFHLYPKA